MKRYEICVQDLMSTALLTVNASETMRRREMEVGVVRHLPVVDDAGALVGLVTQTDFLELARRALLGLPLERVTEAT
jgi:CBS-domain-containing membrane protein